MKDKMICITCPKGCDLTIREEGDTLTVEGNSCPRGKEYALQEIKDPRRTLTTTVRVDGGISPYTSCRTTKPIPKDMIFHAVEIINNHKVKAPIKTGDVIIKDILGTGSDIIATKSVKEIP